MTLRPGTTPIAFVDRLRHLRRMHTRRLRLLLALFLGATALAAEDKRPGKGERQAAEGHMKEELGVNQFTTPGIDLILGSLRDLRPVSYDSIARDLPESTPPDRARLALSAGAVIADGFLAVVAQKQSRIETVGRALMRHAKALGVGEHVTKHAGSILESAARKDWEGVQAELAGAQRDVEKGMMALRDEEVAHLVALGGWWRGLEMTSTIVSAGYSPERAGILVQPSVIDYFIDRVGTLNPSVRQKPLFTTIAANLSEVRKLTVKEDRSAPTEDEVKRVRDLAKATLEAVHRSAE